MEDESGFVHLKNITDNTPWQLFVRDPGFLFKKLPKPQYIAENIVPKSS